VKPSVRPTKSAAGTPVQLRHRAEALVRTQKRKQRPKIGGAKSAADPHRLLHELQVHQLELEMQNSELQEARDRMEVMLEKYTDLYDFAPVGYLSLDEAGTILEANLTGAALLGVERSRLLQRRLPLLVAPPSRPEFLAFLQRLFTTPGRQLCEALLVRENGKLFWGELHGAVALSGDGPRKWCRVAISDVTVLKEAEEVRSRMAAIVQSSDDAIIGTDLNGNITSWNPGAEKIFGYPAPEMVGASILRTIPAARRGEEKLIRERIKSGKSMQHIETQRQTRDDRLIEVSITASPIKDATGAVIGVSKVARDISKRKQAEEILRHSVALFSTLIEAAPIGVYVVDAQFRLQQVNRKARPIFKNIHPLIGRDFSEIHHRLWPKRASDQVVARFRHTLKTGRPYQAPEFTERRRDTGLLEIYQWQIQRITLPTGEYGVVAFFDDITERKRAEDAQRRLAVLTASNLKLEQEIVRRQTVTTALQHSEKNLNMLLAQSRLLQQQLRHLSRQVLQAQEEERKRISRELHDVIAQTLTGINIRLAALKQGAGVSQQAFARNIAATQRLVEKSVHIVHQFARELRPAVLDDLGLIPALHSFMKAFTARTGVRTYLTTYAGVEQLDPARRTVLFRVAQEALTNVGRHAHASRVAVIIQKQPDHLSMKIKDDGKSFRVEQVLRANGGKRLGLLGMRERLEMLGGHLEIQSAPGEGTTIAAQMPLGKIRIHGGGGGGKR
jgi:PAS domain S-box-containing protein